MSLPRRLRKHLPEAAIDSLFLGILYLVTGGVGIPFGVLALAMICRDRARTLL